MLYPPIATVSQDSKPIKFGILGAATIGPNAIISPAKSHAEVVIYAVAARNQERATAYAKKHRIQKAYGGANGYQGQRLLISSECGFKFAYRDVG